MSDGFSYHHQSIADLVQHGHQAIAGHQSNLDASHASLANLSQSAVGKGADAAGQFHQTINQTYGHSNGVLQQVVQAITNASIDMQMKDAQMAALYGTAV